MGAAFGIRLREDVFEGGWCILATLLDDDDVVAFVRILVDGFLNRNIG